MGQTEDKVTQYNVEGKNIPFRVTRRHLVLKVRGIRVDQRGRNEQGIKHTWKKREVHEKFWYENLKRTAGRRRRRWDDNINTDSKEAGGHAVA